MQRVAEGEARDGREDGRWLAGSEQSPCRAASGTQQRWRVSGGAAGNETKENKVANPGLTPLTPATAARASLPRAAGLPLFLASPSNIFFFYLPCCPSAPALAAARHGLRQTPRHARTN
jgi:hypothetical protein